MTERADNCVILADSDFREIRVSTVRGSNRVKKVLTQGDDGYGKLLDALEIAGGIDNPIGELQEEKARLEAETVRLKNEKEEEKAGRKEAEEEKERLEERLKEQNLAISRMLTGGDEELPPEIVDLYPVWEAGLAVDEGDAYRLKNTLFVAKKDHVTSEENGPEGESGAFFWTGGSLTGDYDPSEPEDPNLPGPSYKYPAGSIVEYMGQKYYAREDTDEGPEAGFPTWDLLENRPL